MNLKTEAERGPPEFQTLVNQFESVLSFREHLPEGEMPGDELHHLVERPKRKRRGADADH
jgi:hypothetical protein